MIPIKCLNCGKLIGDIEIPFRTMLAELKASNATQDEINVAVKKFLDDNFIENICCRMNVTTTINLSEIFI